MSLTNEVSTIIKNSMYKDQFVFRPAPKTQICKKLPTVNGLRDVKAFLRFCYLWVLMVVFTFTNYFYC